MRKIYTLIFVFFACHFALSAQDSLLIQGVKYKVDTTVSRHDIGLGALFTKFELPDFPLKVSVLKAELGNPYLKVMTVLSNDSLRGLEQPSKMALRKSNSEQTVIAGINGDFYITSGYDKGLPVNGQVLEGQLAKVPAPSRPLIAFDNNKNPFMGLMTYQGTLTIGQNSYPIDGVNVSRGTDDLILFNQFHGTTTRTNQYGTEVILGLTEGQWVTNSTLTCVVEDIQSGEGSAWIDPGKIILSGHGSSAQLLNGLMIGENIQLEINVSINDGALQPEIVEMIGGDRIILSEGQVQNNNWPEQHPRTAIGFSQDRDSLILAVVDGRSEESAGVSTKQLADLMKLSGSWWALNLDGGGSSVMIVNQHIMNDPSDGYERSVANGFFLASTAPAGSPVTFKLNADSFKIPFGKKVSVKASTFDEYGDVVDYLTASGVSYQVVGGIGSIDENGLFSATSQGSGMIIGTWEGQNDTVFVEVEPTLDLVLTIQELTIDHLNTYQLEVYGKGPDDSYYLLDNSLLDFSTSDSDIGEVDANGIFSGKSDGTVTVTAFIEGTELQDQCIIHVEIGRDYQLLDDFSDPSSWSVTKSFVDQVDISLDVFPGTNYEVMKVDYSMTYAGRTGNIILSKAIDIYGMPDSLLIEAAGSEYNNSFILAIDHPQGLCVVPTFQNTEMRTYLASINTDLIKQEDYPLSFKSLRISLGADPSYIEGETYQGTIFLKSLKAVYPEKSVPDYIKSPVADEKVCEVYPNPARQYFYLRFGEKVVSKLQISITSMSGNVLKKIWLNDLSEGKVFPVSLSSIPKGMVILNVRDDRGMLLQSEKILIQE